VNESRQAEFRRHLRTKPDGRCASCGEPEPCARRRDLAAELGENIALPARVPGAAPSIAARGFGV
jgi:hypothetical protein